MEKFSKFFTLELITLNLQIVQSMVSPRRVLQGKIQSLLDTPNWGKHPEKYLFPSTKQTPQLSNDVMQILKRGGEKSSFSNNWKVPLIDPMNCIVDQFNFIKLVPHLTNPVFLNNSKSISKFLLNRVVNTTETTFRHQLDSPNVPLGKDLFPISSPIVYFHLLNYFSREAFKSNQPHFRNIYQIIHKMNVNEVLLNVDMVNILISNHIGSSNLLDRFQFESGFNKPESFFESMLMYLSLLEKLQLTPNLTTLLLIYSSFPIDSIERRELRSFIISKNFNNSKQWTDIAFIESVQCLEMGENSLGLEILQTIPFINNFTPVNFSLSAIRKSFLNLRFRTPLTFTTFIKTQSNYSYGGWARAVRIVNGVILATRTSKNNPQFNKYIKYSIHERYRPSLTGSIGTILLQKSIDFGSWDTFIKMVNWSRKVEGGKVNWSVIQKSIYALINSNIEPVMKLIIVKYLLNVIPSDSIVVAKRWDKIYWELQDCIDFSFNKNSQLWGDSRLVRNQRTSIGVNRWLSKLSGFNPAKSSTSPLSFNSTKLLKSKSVKPLDFDMNYNLLDEVNGLNLTGDLSYLNDLMTLDLSIVTEFESQLIEDLKNMDLFEANGELTLPKFNPQESQTMDLKINDLEDPILIELKNTLEVKINDFESNYWFAELLNDRYCSWLANRIKIND